MTKERALKKFKRHLLYLLDIKHVSYTDLHRLTARHVSWCKLLGATQEEIDKAALEAFESFFQRSHK